MPIRWNLRIGDKAYYTSLATADSIALTFTSRRTNSDAIAWFEEVRPSYGVMNFSLKDMEEAFFAYLLPCLGPFEDSPGTVAEATWSRRHLEVWERIHVRDALTS